MSVVDRLATTVADRQTARWDRFGGPGPFWRFCLHHPWPVTIGTAAVLAVVLAATFGVPPFSPLVLVVVLVAPILPVLRAQQRAYRRWRGGEGGPDSQPGPEPGPDPDRDPHR